MLTIISALAKLLKDSLVAGLTSKPQRCASCNSSNVTATAVGEREIKALPSGTKKVRINVKMHRLRCHNCKAYRMETVTKEI